MCVRESACVRVMCSHLCLLANFCCPKNPFNILPMLRRKAYSTNSTATLSWITTCVRPNHSSPRVIPTALNPMQLTSNLSLQLRCYCDYSPACSFSQMNSVLLPLSPFSFPLSLSPTVFYLLSSQVIDELCETVEDSLRTNDASSTWPEACPDELESEVRSKQGRKRGGGLFAKVRKVHHMRLERTMAV